MRQLLPDVREIVHRKEIDGHLSPLLLFLDAHAGAELFGKFALKKQELGREVGLARLFGRYAPRELFGVTYVEFSRDNLGEERSLLRNTIHEHQKGARMSFADVASRKSVLHILRQEKNAQGIRDILAAFADTFSDIDVLEAEFFNEAFERVRPIYRIEVFTLEILDDGEFQLHPIIVLTASNDDRHLLDACHFRRAEPAFTGDELILHGYPLSRSLQFFARNRQGLQDAVASDRFRERSERCFVEIFAWLERIWLYSIDFNPKYGVVIVRHRKSISCVPEEGLEPSPLARHDFESCVSAIPPLRHCPPEALCEGGRGVYNTPAMAKKQKILIIVGPTSSGKSTLAVALARKFNGEIISADSRQVYRGLDIGTGKITKHEMKGIRHHLLDIASPKRVFTAHDFVECARVAIGDIVNRGKLPIIAGGTGFYIDALVGRVMLPNVPTNPTLRARLEKKTAMQLFALLEKKDSRRAKTIDPCNKRRLIRALEIVESLGKVPPLRTRRVLDSTVLWIGLKLSQKELEEKIRARLLARMKQGMVTEGRRLHADGLSYRRMEQLGLEYRALARYLRKEISREQMVEGLNRDIRRYAKHQLTYWKRNGSIRWFEPSHKKALLRYVKNWLR